MRSLMNGRGIGKMGFVVLFHLKEHSRKVGSYHQKAFSEDLPKNIQSI